MNSTPPNAPVTTPQLMSDRDGNIESTAVRIYGKVYSIAGCPEEVKQVAAYVDVKMREVERDVSGSLPRDELAVLASMAVIMEQLRAMRKLTLLVEKSHENVDRLSRLVEERAGLAGAAPGNGRGYGDYARNLGRVCERVWQSLQPAGPDREAEPVE